MEDDIGHVEDDQEESGAPPDAPTPEEHRCQPGHNEQRGPIQGTRQRGTCTGVYSRIKPKLKRRK